MYAVFVRLTVGYVLRVFDYELTCNVALLQLQLLCTHSRTLRRSIHIRLLKGQASGIINAQQASRLCATDGARVLESGQVGASLTKASMTARRESVGARPLQAHGALLPIANRGGRAVSPREKRAAVDSCV